MQARYSNAKVGSLKSELFGFEIDSSKINEVTAAGYKSYSIAVYDENVTNDRFQNIFLEINGSEEQRASLITYTINSEKTVTNIEVTPLSGEAPAGSEQKCSMVYFEYCYTCSCAGHGCYDICDCGLGPIKVVESEMVCTFPEFGNGPSIPTSPSQPGGQTGGGGGGVSGNPSIAVPNPATAEKARKKAFGLKLFALGIRPQYDALPENVQGEIWNFLESSLTNGELTVIASEYPVNVVDFAMQMINYLIVNPQPEFTSTNFPGMENGMPFEWWNDDVYINQNFTIFEQLPNVFEIILFKLFPEKALLHINNSLTALNKAYELFLNGTLPGIQDGKADAFRHAYWNALDTSEFGSGLTKVFTDAHEAFSSGLPKQMDLHNNFKGREKADIMNFNFFTSDLEISSSILIEVYIGHLVYINNGVLIPTN